jgi:hypothetical protein
MSTPGAIGDGSLALAADMARSRAAMTSGFATAHLAKPLDIDQVLRATCRELERDQPVSRDDRKRTDRLAWPTEVDARAALPHGLERSVGDEHIEHQAAAAVDLGEPANRDPARRERHRQCLDREPASRGYLAKPGQVRLSREQVDISCGARRTVDREGNTATDRVVHTDGVERGGQRDKLREQIHRVNVPPTVRFDRSHTGRGASARPREAASRLGHQSNLRRFCFIKLLDGEVETRAELAAPLRGRRRRRRAPADESAARWDLSIVITTTAREAWGVFDELSIRAAVVKAWTFDAA